MKRSIDILVIAAILMAGCKHGEQIQQPEADTAAVAEVPRTVADECVPLEYSTLTAHFGCEVQGWQLSGQVRIVRDSVIWISVNKIVELGRMLITTDSVKLYLKINNNFFTASFDGLREKFGIDLDYGILQALLTGDNPTLIERDSSVVRSIVTEVDSILRRILSTDIRTSVPRQHLHVDYSRFEPISGVPFAMTLGALVESRAFRAPLTLRYNKVLVNAPVSTPFTIPHTAKPLTGNYKI